MLDCVVMILVRSGRAQVGYGVYLHRLPWFLKVVRSRNMTVRPMKPVAFPSEKSRQDEARHVWSDHHIPGSVP